MKSTLSTKRTSAVGAAILGALLALSIAAACEPEPIPEGTTLMPDEQSTYPLTEQGIPCWQDLHERWLCLLGDPEPEPTTGPEPEPSPTVVDECKPEP